MCGKFWSKYFIPTGHFCPLGTEFAVQHPCDNGTFNNATNSATINSCQLCLPGHYCPDRGMPEPAGLCAPGWYCTLGSWAYKPTIQGNDTGATCMCPAQSMGGMCKAGTYCPPGTSSPVPCDPGKYCQTDELAAITNDCQAGYFCNGSTILPNPINETTGDICPKGHYCPNGSAVSTPCNPGKFSDRFANQEEANCLACTAGKYCSGYGRDLPNGPCDVGWFCPENMTVPQPPGNECLPGHGCPLGSPVQTPCESGFYQPLPGIGACLECPAGMYCDRNEAIAEAQSGLGVLSHGVKTPKACPAGFYCPNGTQTRRQFPCPVGTYSNSSNVENITECRLCPAGFYCEAENITEPTGKCAPGYYCVLGATTLTPASSTRGGPCLQGWFCETGWSWPTPCPKGTFGDRDHLPSEPDCTTCPPGEFCAQSGLGAPNGSCLAGFYCSNRSEEANPVGKAYGDECPVGYFCPDHSYEPTACPAGSYQPYVRMTNITACLQCDPGKFCNSTGLAAVSGDCEAGFYCSGGASLPVPLDGTTGDICPAGSYCPLGSPTHYYCANGTYTNHTGSSYCYACPQGYYCDMRDRAVLCPVGHYCPESTGADWQPCPAGTYNPQSGLRNVTECTQCDGGRFCLTPGRSAVSGNCTAGYFCRTGKHSV